MTSTTAQCVAAYWTRQLDALRAGLAAIGDGDLAAVHRSRVAIRRLRSTMRTFADLLDAELTGGLDAGLRQLAAELGEVRDRQVLRELYAGWPGADETLRAAVTQRLDAEIAAAGERLGALVAGPRVALVLEQVADVTDSPPADGDAGRLRARSVRQVARRFRRADTPNPDPVRLHAVRKAVKRARYAAEVFTDDPGAQHDVRLFEQLQEVLGRHQDLALASTYLHAAAQEDVALAGPASAHWVAELAARAAEASREAFVTAAATGTYPPPR